MSQLIAWVEAVGNNAVKGAMSPSLGGGYTICTAGGKEPGCSGAPHNKPGCSNAPQEESGRSDAPYEE